MKITGKTITKIRSTYKQRKRSRKLFTTPNVKKRIIFGNVEM